ncbi:hypothetical protein MLD38_009906 [Melastoma candidum]|uniref:Uncharacterized protein n=1 Tax=Melastoma candidum TaxID=119954 RepID=A0ACB9QZZ4_9MYRT|nr:hypothetical protein MLD38_009906 [Melastoma candidum]
MNGCCNLSSIRFACGTPVHPNFSNSISISSLPKPPSTPPSPPIPFRSPSDASSFPIATTSRRETIGIALSLGLLAFPWQFPSQLCYAAEALPLELTVAPSGLAYFDKAVGNGPEAAKGQLIKVVSVLPLENGKVFDSSYNRGKPLTFRVGVGEVIKGWDEGILGGDGVTPMLAEDTKDSTELAYGMRGAGCSGGSCIIPPGSVLLFDVEFIGKA